MKNNILTRESFVQFLLSMATDFERNPSDWENRSIPSFLEAMASWIEDMDGFYVNQNLPVPDDINWSHLADMIMAARIYE